MGKKIYFNSLKGVSEYGNKKYTTETKKYTALNQKEWVSGNAIFTQEKKYTIPLT